MKTALIKKSSILSAALLASAGAASASTDYGPAIWHPICASNWYNSGNGHHFCVIHDMEGYYASTIAWFDNCSMTSASVYYCVNGKQDAASDAPAGEITQLGVREAQYAWHASCWNTWMWGTEHEGFASNPAWYTDAMYTSSAALQKHLMLQTAHPIDRNHIIAHGEKSNTAWRNWMAANYPSINTTCNTHTDPGPYWDWNKFMGLMNGVNPPYYFDNDAQGWTSGNSLSPLTWYNVGWPGIIYADQTGNDAFYYSGPTSYTGGAEASCNVSIYPQSGTTANHDMQIFWKTAADNTWTAGKSSPAVSYTLQNNWGRINLDINQAWPSYFNQTITQLRLDMDNNNSGTRWIVNHVITQGSLRWRFDADPMGWTSANSLSPIAYSNTGWPGIIYADQTGNDPQFLSTGGWVMYGAINDTIHVRVYPQNGSTANHDMQIFFSTGAENFFSEDKSLTTYYTAKDGWADVWFDVGVLGKWNSDYVRQIRLDVDQINQGNRWIIDSVTVEHNTSPSYIHAPTIGQQPSSQTVVIGQNADFSVYPNGPAPFTYQWYVNGNAIAGATGRTFTKANCQLADAGNYSCVVANSGGSISSAAATLTVNGSAPVTAIVDNSSAGFSVVGAWSTGTSSTDKYGADYRFRSTAAVSEPAQWVANLANSGTYNVYAWWSQGANRSTTAPYIVYYNGGSVTVNKNQQANGGAWNLLGSYNLLSGNNTVKLSCWTTTGFVVMADAIQWQQQ